MVVSPLLEALGAEYALAVKGTHGRPNGGGHSGRGLRSERRNDVGLDCGNSALSDGHADRGGRCGVGSRYVAGYWASQHQAG